MTTNSRITAPDSPALDELCRELAARAEATDASGDWPAEQLDSLGDCGVYQWYLPEEWGGQGWSDADIARGYFRLAAACLTTTFILTQRVAACRRIVDSPNPQAQESLLPGLATGSLFATVGISHLTTSRRHVARPVLTAHEVGGGFVLDGYSPWVTGADQADSIVMGATLADGREVLLAVPGNTPGIEPAEPARLVALSASHTGAVHCRQALVERRWLLAGPVEHVIKVGGAGGLQTSALAVGLAAAAIDFLVTEADMRNELATAAASLGDERQSLEREIVALSGGEPACPAPSTPAGAIENVRARANSLALRATQAALTAAKGAGFLQGHPAGRWCREALFFLVWSCPQGVAAANLCELAGIE
jgi:alkylation response protein AidB-like acyl-CoA dehydrogenase